MVVKEVKGCSRQPKVVSPGKVIQRAPGWVEVKPRKMTYIDEEKLPLDEASEEIQRLRRQVEWYAEYTAKLKTQIAEGEAKFKREGADITLTFEGEDDWGSYDGSAGIRAGEGWHRIDLSFNPIPLRLYKLRDGTVHIISPAEWITIGDVEVIEEVERVSWYEKVRFGIGGGACITCGIKPTFSVEIGYDKYILELVHSSGNDILLLKYCIK
ncbi:MAG: hypothetical protein DRH51_08645 [Candidatus Coatesbacteria bacterium]|nr:MAG: hypothetical protein DRH51_08645 [Candidatus Coatesbacteria bacterium]